MKGVQRRRSKKEPKGLQTRLAAFAFIILFLNQNSERCLSTDSMTQEVCKKKKFGYSQQKWNLVTSPDASGTIELLPKSYGRKGFGKPVYISCLPVNQDREH